MRRARPWVPDGSPVLVVVPHPDDESLMFGGVLAQCAMNATPVHLLAVTDGGAAYPDAVDPSALARLRRDEQVAALAELGLADAKVTRLDIPDGHVADHEDALVDTIVDMLADEHIGAVLTPWEHDHHSDHEACGRAVTRARLLVGAERPFTVVSGLFWSMLRDPAPPDVTLSEFTLSAEHLARKQAAIRRHHSQIDSIDGVDRLEPVLGSSELALTRWSREHVIVTSAS